MSYKMSSYKGWTGEQRKASLRLTNKAKQLGLLEEPKKCKFCGQEKGILHTHNENYGVTLELVPKMIAGTATEEEIQKVKDVLWPICWRCHMIWHSKHRAPQQVEKYFEEVRNGKQYPPVFVHNFDILRRDHNIY